MTPLAWLWFRRLWPLLLVAIALAFLTVGARRWLRRHDAAVSRDAQLGVYLPQAAAESVVVVRWDTIVRRDTVHLAKWLTRYETVRDTLNVHDTVQVRAFVAAADSTVRACRLTVIDLLSSCQAKDTLIATQRKIIAAYQLAPPVDPPPRRRWSFGVTAGYGVVLDGGQLHRGLGATAGVNWRVF